MVGIYTIAIRAGAALLAVAATGCFPVRLARPVRGIVVDAASGEPIPGALLEMEARSRLRLQSGLPTEAMLQRDWTVTDDAGRFTVGGGVNPLVFPRVGWETDVAVDPIGYFAGGCKVRDSYPLGWPRLRVPRCRIPLRRIRYQLDLDERRENGSALLQPEARAKWDGQIRQLGPSMIRTRTPAGAFATVPGAVFDRVGFIRGTVVARDNSAGTTLAWTSLGDPVPPDAGTAKAMAADGQASDAGGPSTPRCKHTMTGPLVPGCLACTANQDAVYHATDEGGIRKFAIRYGPLRYEEDTAFAERVGRIAATGATPRRFLDVDVGDGGRVYAVAGDGVVYRFSPDGEPDQEIELDRSTLGAPARFSQRPTDP